jgi:radical SAM superfamily enzyme YgiQ (UPF0313 family)
MKILLLYPEFPDTFWSFKHALTFVGKKATFPPLGLLTVAAMLPEAWGKRLVDLNVQALKERDLKWADLVFISGMCIQKDSAKRLVARCKAAGLTVVAGGPLFTMEAEAFPEVDHLVMNEAENTLPRFLEDWSRGKAERVYRCEDFPDLATSPTPLWDLADFKQYHSMALQYTRGCPFNCDFCNITSLLGRRVRTKTTDQVLAELNTLHAAGWEGRVFFVDDNFIGNKRRLKKDLLPRLVEWRRTRPNITFQTEASINLADDEALMELMSAAGFDTVFVGIETPEEASLAECSKRQNERRDLVADVKKIQRAGLQVQGGFIVGFDHDGPSVFQKQIDFIQRSGVVTAMVGLLQAPRGTRLYERMRAQGRLLGRSSGDNVEGTTNIVPLMDEERLHQGYRRILDHIYSPRPYYRRIKTLLSEYRPPRVRSRVTRTDLVAFFKSTYRLGILGKERLQYWRLLAWTTLRRPRLFPMAVTLAISGYHFRKVCELRVR